MNENIKNMLFLKNIFILAIATTLLFTQCQKSTKLSAIVISGQDEKSSSDVKSILTNTGLFEVDIDNSSSPDFSNYNVVVVNTDKGNWDDKTKESFVTYVKNGGGVIVLNSSGSAFPGWTDYQSIVGLSSDQSGKKSNIAYDYQVVNEKETHPITKGLNKVWLHNKDYMLYSTTSLGNGVEILSTAIADSIHGGSGNSLPVIFTVQFGEGRVLHSTLGNNAQKSMQCVGFITTLQRGAEWAATGAVTQEVSLDFPTFVSKYTWIDFKPLKLDEIFIKASTYQVGKSRKYLDDISLRIRNCDGKPETYKMYEDKILAFLESQATVDSKRYLCKELSWIGSENATSVLEKLVNDKNLSNAASYALQRLRL